MKNILLVSHYTATPGVMDKFLDFLIRKGFAPALILNPLDPKSALPSQMSFCGQEISYKLPGISQYLLEGAAAIYKFKIKFKITTGFDTAICFDPLSFINVHIFKKYFRVRKIVYYNVDFSTKRFSNNLLNSIYLAINKFAYKKCDYFLYLSESFIKNIDPMKKYTAKSFLLRHTIPVQMAVGDMEKIPNSLIYVGTLSKTVNFVNLIRALELIKNQNLDFIFDIYGDGDQVEFLKAAISCSSIRPNVNFKGVVKNEILFKEILPKYKIGLCPYIIPGGNNTADHMFNGTDLTMKIVEYIACGLPVVSTKLYKAFDIIEENKFGFLVKDINEWNVAISRLLTDDNLYQNYARNALDYSKNYDEERVLSPILLKILT